MSNPEPIRIPEIMFVVMQRNGTYEDQRSKPIRTFRYDRDANALAARMNRDAAILMGKIEARDLLLDYWDSTHAHHIETEVRVSESSQERERLTSILGIQADCAALGFSNEHAVDHPFWSVVEVPHGGE